MLAGESPVERNEDTEADVRAGKEVKADIMDGNPSRSHKYFAQNCEPLPPNRTTNVVCSQFP